MLSVPDPFNGHHEMRHNSTVPCQNQLKFWNQKAKQIFSLQFKSFGPYANIFGPRLFFVESLKETWDRQTLIDSQNRTSSWTFNV